MIAASAGNHAQGVAYHAGRHGIRAQICMPLTTPLIKVSATKSYGAEVILHGANYDEACEEAVRRSAQFGMTFIHPFDDEVVIAGQGTMGLEILQQVPDVEAIVAPIGGGGLIAGVACAAKETNPRLRGDWCATGASAVDESGDCRGPSGDVEPGSNHCRWHRRSPGGEKTLP